VLWALGMSYSASQGWLHVGQCGVDGREADREHVPQRGRVLTKGVGHGKGPMV
jgi:hypothetical protein